MVPLLVFGALCGVAVVLGTLLYVGPALGAGVEQIISLIQNIAMIAIYWVAWLSPAVVAILPLLVKREGGTRTLIISAFYGLVVMLILYYLGLFSALTDALEQHIYYSSWSSIAIGAINLAKAIFAWICGLFCRFCDYVIFPIYKWAKKHAR